VNIIETKFRFCYLDDESSPGRESKFVDNYEEDRVSGGAQG
jgi:hypothetical protein